MITVLNIIDTGGPGGAETVFLQKVTRLDPRRFRPIAVVSHPGWLSDRLRENGISPLIVPARGSFHVRYLASLLEIARKSRPDVIVAHLYGPAVYGSLLGALVSTPVVSILHGQTDLLPSERLARVKAAIVRRGSRKVVFVSGRLRADLAARLRLRSDQGIVIPNGVDTNAFQPSPNRSLRIELGLPDDAVIVGAVGNVRPAKAYNVLLEAVRLLLARSQRSGLRFHFIIVGECSGPLGRDLKSLAGRLGIERSVTFLGLRSDVAQVLNGLNIFVLSSTTEGFSIACIEAMACGIPVVATSSGGPDEILEGGAGILVPTRSPDAIANAVERLAASGKEVAHLRQVALRRVHEEFSLTTMIARYEQLLMNLARK